MREAKRPEFPGLFSRKRGNNFHFRQLLPAAESVERRERTKKSPELLDHTLKNFQPPPHQFIELTIAS